MKYFTLPELCVTAQKLPNVPNEEQKKNLIALVDNVLDPARELLGAPIGINSGFRSIEVNKAIGGAAKIVNGQYVATSQHCQGQAADLRCLDKPKLFNIIKDNLVFDQLIKEHGTEASPAWIHVSFRADGKNRGEMLYIDTNNKTKILGYKKFS